MISCQGKHNRIKALSFIVMIHEGRGLTSDELAFNVGNSRNRYASLRTLLVRWCRWGYVKLWMSPDGTRFYSIMPKGESWLRRHWVEIVYSLNNEWLPGFWNADYFSFLLDKPGDTARQG